MLKRSKVSGLSLLELVVGMALVLVVGLLMARFLAAANQATVRSTAESNLFRLATLIESEIARDLNRTTIGGTTLLSPADGSEGFVAMQPVQGVSLSGETTYFTDRLILYHWQPTTDTLSKFLYQGSLPLPLRADSPLRLSQSQCLGLLSADSGLNRRFPGVTRFRLTSANAALPAPNIGVPLQLNLDLVQPRNPKFTYSLKKQFVPRMRL